jgi:hypothetical protein
MAACVRQPPECGVGNEAQWDPAALSVIKYIVAQSA